MTAEQYQRDAFDNYSLKASRNITTDKVAPWHPKPTHSLGVSKELSVDRD